MSSSFSYKRKSELIANILWPDKCFLFLCNKNGKGPHQFIEIDASGKRKDPLTPMFETSFQLYSHLFAEARGRGLELGTEIQKVKAKAKAKKGRKDAATKAMQVEYYVYLNHKKTVELSFSNMDKAVTYALGMEDQGHHASVVERHGNCSYLIYCTLEMTSGSEKKEAVPTPEAKTPEVKVLEVKTPEATQTPATATDKGTAPASGEIIKNIKNTEEVSQEAVEPTIVEVEKDTETEAEAEAANDYKPLDPANMSYSQHKMANELWLVITTLEVVGKNITDNAGEIFEIARDIFGTRKLLEYFGVENSSLASRFKQYLVSREFSCGFNAA